MFTRRHLLGAAATSPMAILPLSGRTSEKKYPLVADLPTLHRISLPRLQTGLPTVDAATDGISIGGLTAIVGHSCSGKTKLALAIAQSVRDNYQANVLVLSAREPVHWLARRSDRPPVSDARTVVVPSNWTASDFNLALHSSVAKTYLAPFDTWAQVEQCSTSRCRDCLIVILDGFGTLACAPPERVIHTADGPAFMDGSSCYPPILLTESQVLAFSQFAETFEIPVILTLRLPTYADDDPARFLVTATDHSLRVVLGHHCDRTLWLLRTKVWNKNIPEDTLEILSQRRDGEAHRLSLPLST